ncbi:hypothetical protein ACFYZB_00560 [Streptomyces sp. NPDC001852]
MNGELDALREELAAAAESGDEEDTANRVAADGERGLLRVLPRTGPP